MTIKDYLPKPSDNAMKFENDFKQLENKLYAVKTTARNAAYKLNASQDAYAFVYNSDADEVPIETTFPFTINDAGTYDVVNVDCDAFDVKLYLCPVDQFLRGSTYAGDAVAVHVPTGEMIVKPEFMTVEPTTKIKEFCKEFDPSTVEELSKFKQDIIAQVSNELLDSNRS